MPIATAAFGYRRTKNPNTLSITAGVAITAMAGGILTLRPADELTTRGFSPS